MDTPIISIEECKRFIIDCMSAVGTPKDHSKALAELLVQADYRGHYSHGMNRLDVYVDEVKCGICDGKAKPKILKESASTALVDGQNGLGAVVGEFSMNLAIKKAKENGIGIVIARGSNHFGIAGHYSLQALNQGMIGISFTNSSPALVPTRAKEASLGTNPISFFAPASNGDSFELDMATTTVALGKVEIKARQEENLPNNWALNQEGEPATNPLDVLHSNRLTPLGGSETNSGYKGTGLAFMVEILCGILGGGSYGPNVRKWRDSNRTANLGHCFIAINPTCFDDECENSLADLMSYIRSMNPVDPEKPVIVAGDPEKAHMKIVDEIGGIRYIKTQLEACNEWAQSLNVKPLSPC